MDSQFTTYNGSNKNEYLKMQFLLQGIAPIKRNVRLYFKAFVVYVTDILSLHSGNFYT